MAGGDKKIKSALDIALEKAQKLGSLSVEERQRLKEDELRAVGEALGKRHLDGLPPRDIEIELRRYKEEERHIVARYLLSSLWNLVDISDIPAAESALAAIQYLSGNSDAVEGIRNLLSEHQRAIEEAWRENRSTLEADKVSQLRLKGISGSAINPGVETYPEWLEIQHQLDSYYRERLEELKAPWKQI